MCIIPFPITNLPSFFSRNLNFTAKKAKIQTPSGFFNFICIYLEFELQSTVLFHSQLKTTTTSELPQNELLGAMAIKSINIMIALCDGYDYT